VLTRDENIVRVEVNVQYRVNDPQRYLFGSRDADKVLRSRTALSTVREQVGRSTARHRAQARSALSGSALQRLQEFARCVQYGLGRSPGSACPTRVRRMK
jgi:membrane protease subunit HflK